MLAPFIYDRLVLRGIGQHGHMLPIFGGAAHHGRPANVDVFNRVIQAAVGHGYRGLERVQIDHQHIDGVDAVVLQGLHVLRHITPRQQAAVHFGMQGFHATIEHFCKPSDLGHFAHRQSL